ncbi:Maf-like protein [Zhouia spongiae]|uniref:dTTP/UTP pyrophosphatase n=1 Tax=Zhouia spongiae TaxID=2202721 RepID=A0ABY3YJ03_9FLAO|nr:Maf-like protein [Zhouia spongiae]UNY97812.1 Maf-like protein [Zhouia spongiae]
MLNDILKNHHLILASGSPRRQKFFKDLGLDFEIRLKPVEEICPDRLRYSDIPDFLAQLKAIPFKETLSENDILITSDTIVWHNNQALGKPKTKQEAFEMLQSLSGNAHEVITSICLTTNKIQKTVNSITKVFFNELTEEEIRFYIQNYKPFDKAGAYGIQEWIGLVGIKKIEGSYFNVVGLPVHLLYKTLKTIVE